MQVEGDGLWGMAEEGECSEKELKMSILWYSGGLKERNSLLWKPCETNTGVLPGDLALPW